MFDSLGSDYSFGFGLGFTAVGVCSAVVKDCNYIKTKLRRIWPVIALLMGVFFPI